MVVHSAGSLAVQSVATTDETMADTMDACLVDPSGGPMDASTAAYSASRLVDRWDYVMVASLALMSAS